MARFFSLSICTLLPCILVIFLHLFDHSLALHLEQTATDKRFILKNVALPLSRRRSVPENVTFVLDQFELFAPDAQMIEETPNGVIHRNIPNYRSFSGRLAEYGSSFVSLTQIDGQYKGIVSLDSDNFYFEWSDRDTNLQLKDVEPFVPPNTTCAPLEVPHEEAERQLREAQEFRNVDIENELENIRSNIKRQTIPQSNPYTIRLALECDDRVYSRFGSYDPAAAYFTSVFTYISGIYRAEINATIQITTFICSATDPYTQFTDAGAGLTQMLNYWRANRASVPRDIAALVASASGMGGIAYVRAACNTQYGYSVSGVTMNAPGNIWDYVVLAHEIGHNIGTSHTHCYSPPIDTCYNQEDNCYSGSTRTVPATKGSIMSYCHLLTGGLNNIALSMGKEGMYGDRSERVITTITSYIRSITRSNCMPCIPTGTCQSLGYDCGSFDNGCGSLLNCGSCTAPAQCESNVCVQTIPTISGISPNTGSTEGGTLVTLSGNFGSFEQGTSAVTMNGQSVTIVSWNVSRINFNTIAGQGTGITVTVRNKFGNTVSTTFNYAAPSISSFNPSNGPTAGNTSITIQGTNFGTSGTVTFGSSPVSTTSWSHRSIVFRLPAGQGTVDVSVTVAGQTSSTSSFTYSPPTIQSFTPQNGPTQGGGSLTLTGVNFGTSGTVTLGGNSCNIVSYSHTTIVCTIPPGQGLSQRVSVAVATHNVQSTSTFNYDAPVLDDVTPNTVYTLGGGSLQLTGVNFGITPRVIIGGSDRTEAECEISENTHSLVRCVPPPGRLGEALIWLDVEGQLSNELNITYNEQPPPPTTQPLISSETVNVEDQPENASFDLYSTFLIATIVIGVCVLAAAITLLVLFIVLRNKQKQQYSQMPIQMEPMSQPYYPSNQSFLTPPPPPRG